MTHEFAELANGWTLTEFGPGEKQERMIELPCRELIVGRSSDADVMIGSSSVSSRHASLTFADSQMIVEDLGSTNGTFLNGQPVNCSTAVEGDLLQFANSLFRVGRSRREHQDGTIKERILPWAQTLILFDRMITERAVTPHFQPIISMDRQQTPGFELLARSSLEGLTNPALMFGAAERLGQEAALSELMRDEGLKIASQSKHSDASFFLNTHSAEVINDRLVQSLQKLREDYSDTAIVIEIHETAVTDPTSMRELKTLLDQLEMQLSYDDFGAGQGRLAELAEVPPDILKFDMQLIRGIDSAAASRQDMLATLVRLASDLGATPLAEGVETEGEHNTCAQMGFQLGQGFLYGRPMRF